MIFEVQPSQIINLNSLMFVELLRKLIHSEASKSGIALRSVSVPLQITIADGGEDARVAWEGGHEKTDYFPCRFSIFQSKATDPQPAGWKKEVWTKSSQKDGAPRVLNDAMSKALAEEGAYIGFTSKPIVGNKYDRRIKAIKDGVIEAGGNPARLKAIDIYDANKIAAWVTSHPALAVWLNEQESGLKLAGFQTMEYWGKKIDISSIKYVEDKATRFSFGFDTSIEDDSITGNDNSMLTSSQAKEQIYNHLAESKKYIRIIGPSGIGKSRFAFECFNETKTLSHVILSSSAIFCDYRTIGNKIFEIATALSRVEANTLLVVDECSREDAIKLGDIIMSEDGNLQIITIGLDDRPINNKSCLNLSLNIGDSELIEGIIQQRHPKADASEVQYIKNLCGGFPKIAVLATDNYSENAPILRSIEDVVERILKSSGIVSEERMRSIECLSLFERIGCDDKVSDQIDLVATILARQTGDQMFEFLAEESKHHLVDRRGLYFYAQPLPIAAYLGERRLELIRVNTILSFLEAAPEELILSFLNLWRNFNSSRNAISVADKLLHDGGRFGSIEALNSEFGSKCFDALVHVVPDSAAETLSREISKKSIKELLDLNEGRSYLVTALEKLVFRTQSFPIAARILLRLAAAENQTWSNNSTGAFCQLFNLELSGSEVEPIEKFAVIDEALKINEDEKIIEVCIKALAYALNRHHFTRIAGSEQIGNRPPLHDWYPKHKDEVTAFHLDGLKRLLNIRLTYPNYALECEKIISSHLRSLIYEEIFPELKIIVQKIVKEKILWLEAIQSIGDWLYFDRKKSLETFILKVRNFYDDLIPKDLVSKALLYTKFWPSNIRDPDVNYDPGNIKDNEFEFATKKSKEIAILISKDRELVIKCLDVLMSEHLNNSYPFAYELALNLENPIEVFEHVIKLFDQSIKPLGLGIVQGLLSGIQEKNDKNWERCFEIAKKSEMLKPYKIQLYTVSKISKDRLDQIVIDLKSKEINAQECVSISYGQRLNKLSPEDITPLIDELILNHDGDGMWAALQILQMYKYGERSLELSQANKIKEIVCSENLLNETGKNSRDAHVLESLINLISKKYGIDEKFASELSVQLTRFCNIKDYGLFYSLSLTGNTLIKLLVQKQPLVIWKVLSEFFETCSPSEANKLQKLVSPQLHGHDSNNKDESGALFGLPSAVYLDWAKAAPATRSPFLCTFFPFIEESATGKYTWHPEFMSLLNEFGAVPEFQRAIWRRIFPTSWSGNLSTILLKYLEPIEDLFSNQNPDLGLWARQAARNLNKSIKQEKKFEIT